MSNEHPVVVCMHRGGDWHGHTFIVVKGYAFNQAGGGDGIPEPYAKYRKVSWERFIHNYVNNQTGKWLQRFVCLLNDAQVELAYNYLNTRFYQGTRNAGSYVETDPTTVLHQYHPLTANCAIVTSKALKNSGFLNQDFNSPAGLASALIIHRKAYQIETIHPVGTPGGELQPPGDVWRKIWEYFPGAFVNWLMR